MGDRSTIEWTDATWNPVARATSHVFQVLTKRPARMRSYLVGDGITRRPWIAEAAGASLDDRWPLPNVWLGTSVEDQAAADLRIPHLLRTPAAVRFLSCEPLLGSVDLLGRHTRPALGRDDPGEERDAGYLCDIDWVIAGGESGPGARPMHPDWARSLRDQCVAAGVPFFFKQWGEWWPVGPQYSPEDDEESALEAIHEAADIEVSEGKEVVALERNGTVADGYQPTDDRTWLMGRLGKKAAGRELDGRTWDEMPEARGA